MGNTPVALEKHRTYVQQLMGRESNTKTVRLGQWDGAGDGWTAPLSLKDWGAASVVVDASALRFATTTFLLRLRTFVEWHLSHGREVQVIGPRYTQVANYMARMRMGDELPPTVFLDLPNVQEHQQSEVLIPVTRLRDFPDVDRFNEDLAPLIAAHATDVAVLEDALSMAVSELCGNAVEHGDNPLGCYVAAQRFARPTPRTVLTVGDMGCGIPKNIKRHFDGLDEDRDALDYALRQGITTTGRDDRGQGFYWVLDAAKQSHIRAATLDIRSGRGHVVRALQNGSTKRNKRTAPNKIGTWVTLELGPKATREG